MTIFIFVIITTDLTTVREGRSPQKKKIHGLRLDARRPIKF